MTTDRATESLRPFVDAWRVAGPWLDQVRLTALRRQTEAQRVEARQSLYELGGELGRCRATSGLIEQQAIFRRLS